MGRAAQAVENRCNHHRNPHEPLLGCPDTSEDNHVNRVARRGRITHFSSKFMSEHGDGCRENHHRIRYATFAENTAVMRGLAKDLRAKGATAVMLINHRLSASTHHFDATKEAEQVHSASIIAGIPAVADATKSDQ